MTRYTVTWDEDVEGPFIDAWVRGDDTMRRTLTEIADWVDSQLREDPVAKGEATDEPGTRIVVVMLSSSLARISVVYEVWPDDRLVRIVRLTFRI